MGNKLNVVLDTNWYISAVINARSRRRLYTLLVHPKLSIYYCAELWQEFAAVMARPKFLKYRTSATHRLVEAAKLILHEVSLEPATARLPKKSRDSKDNYLIALSLSCAAHYLVTGDEDLLVLGAIGQTRVVTMATFQEVLGSISMIE